jgi:5'(3')-deoxyribonucleotidase
LKIAVDIDGVLADQVGAVLKVIEEEYGQKYCKSDINRAHWTFDGMELWSEIGRLLADPEYTRNLPLIEGSQRGVKQLIHHDVFVVTARRPNAEEATKQWLNKLYKQIVEPHHVYYALYQLLQYPLTRNKDTSI